MNKIYILSIPLLSILLTSCGFLLSPVGEELIVDGAQELIKIEEELVHPSHSKEPEKIVSAETPKEPINEEITVEKK